MSVVYAVVIAGRIPQDSLHSLGRKGTAVLDLTTLTGHELSSTSKGVPDVLDGVAVADVPTRRLNLLKQAFPAPVAVLRQSAIRANINLMRSHVAPMNDAAMLP